jgi:hypothetical protein
MPVPTSSHQGSQEPTPWELLRATDRVIETVSKLSTSAVTEQLFIAGQKMTDLKIDGHSKELTDLREFCQMLELKLEGEKAAGIDRERKTIETQAASRRLIYSVILGGIVSVLGQIYLNVQGVA